MRDASPECIAYVNANNVAFRADLLTVILANGSTYRWTTWDTDLAVQCWNFNAANSAARTPNEGVLTYKTPVESDSASAPIIAIGTEDEGEDADDVLSVCSLDVMLSGSGFKIGSKSLPVLAADGALDGAYIRLDHLIMPAAGDTSLQSFVDFEGRVSQPDIGTNEVTLHCKSWLEQAAATMLPKRTYSPNCTWEFCGGECGLSLDTLETSGTITAVTSASVVTATTLAHNAETYTKISLGGQIFPVPITETRGHFDMGVVWFDDGSVPGRTATATAALRGVRADIVSQDGSGVFTLAMPLPATPQAGDTFLVWPGCRLDYDNCRHFSNTGRYGGFPFVPPNTSAPVG